MIYHATTIDEMIHALESMKLAGAVYVGTTPANDMDGPLSFATIDLVWVNRHTGRVTGDESEDHEPGPEDVCVARIQ